MTITSFWLYPKTEIEITPWLIQSSINLLEPGKDRVDVSRNNRPDDSWETHVRELQTPEELGGFYINSGRDFMLPGSSIVDVSSHYIGNHIPLFLDMSASSSRRHFSVIEEVESLDVSVKREFSASNCELTFGFHDIYQPGTEIREPEFFARPLLSFCFWGYGFVDRLVFLEHFRKLRSVVLLGDAFAQLWGPIDCAITTLSE